MASRDGERRHASVLADNDVSPFELGLAKECEQYEGVLYVGRCESRDGQEEGLNRRLLPKFLQR